MRYIHSNTFTPVFRFIAPADPDTHLDRDPDPVQLCRRQQVVDGKVLHQRVVIVDRADGLQSFRDRFN
jgi:hypothetical protein